MRHARTSATLLALLALSLPGAALAQDQLDPGKTQANATLPDIEDEVMCTICGTALQLANSPQAERERAFINELISRGKTKDEIKDALVKQYGPAVLAVPKAEGFDLMAFVIPIAGVLLVLISVGLAARRWRRSGGGGSPPAAPMDPAEDERLSADMRRYSA
jgi:cytochrome c-type biogenesis protein CcmH